jgi:hypothetical protein
MKRTLWTFGDSYTESFSDNTASWVENYCKWKGYTPKVYGQIISDKLDLELINLGKGGSDNYSIFQSICNSVHNIKSDDIIIVGWSSVFRFRLANIYDIWKPILPVFDKNRVNLENISQITIDEILVNRNHNLYSEEVRSWIKLLNFTFSNNIIIHWSPFEGNHSPTYFRNLTTIRSETNGDCNDGHYSELGHIELSNALISIIYNGNKVQKLI